MLVWAKRTKMDQMRLLNNNFLCKKFDKIKNAITTTAPKCQYWP